MSGFTLKKDTALDLKLKGSIGTFKIGPKGEESTALEVKYFLTHVGLNFESGTDEKLLSKLAPVREIFDFNKLDFDEIMQRDIDDARVSSELIPYLLDKNPNNLIKFFPPIIVMVMPVEEDSNHPACYFPEVSVFEQKAKEGEDYSMLITRSGELSQEVFQFEQPIVGTEAENHDLVALRLNTQKSRLIIVDGQHRAMALLSLYRNIKDDWSDARRKPFQNYYAEWTPEYIKKFELKDIHLPMIICTVPDLDKKFTSKKYDLIKACRSIFLALNKNARPVSKSRNLLLDDNNLISSFMRKTLSYVKNQDLRSPSSFELHCVELDQHEDKVKIKSPVAITGVSHLYYIIEHLLLNNEIDLNGIKARSGKFKNRTDITKALERLNTFDSLGKNAVNNIRRNFFDKHQESTLKEKYFDRYGKYIFYAFSEFTVFHAHNQATLSLREELGKNADVLLKPMLFDGQGMARIFNSHLDKLTEKLKNPIEEFGNETPKIKTIQKNLNDTKIRFNNAVESFEKQRVMNYLKNIPKTNIHKDNDIGSNLLKICNKWYKNIYSTVAFQSGLICGFFYIIEKNSCESLDDALIEKLFHEYIESLNKFFSPSSFKELKIIMNLFEGKTSGDNASTLKIVEKSEDTFRSVINLDEMQPDQWPKYMYILLEIWKSSNDSVNKEIKSVLKKCRSQVFETLFKKKKEEYLIKEKIISDDFNHDMKENVINDSFSIYKNFMCIFDKKDDLILEEIKKTFE